jgi:hypothetical protein
LWVGPFEKSAMLGCFSIKLPRLLFSLASLRKKSVFGSPRGLSFVILGE